MNNIELFENYESQVRSYCRKYPVVFKEAIGSELFSEDGVRYIDFLDAAGSLNYGHNNPYIKGAIMDYLRENNVINALDMYTVTKRSYLQTFNDLILRPRRLTYKIMCCGPTGTNAIEAALKLSRKVKKNNNIFACSGAFHGMTLGSLSLTTDLISRRGANVPLNNVTFIPYDKSPIDSITYLRWVLSDDHSGIDKPSALFIETVQAEGGINVASVEWLQEIRKICDEYGILLVCDDIQVGNGRTGSFFSFERAGIEPDMVVLSKSISGFGLPMSILLMKPEYDIFLPAEHNGTFRGNQLSFVGGQAAIEFYCNKNLDEIVRQKQDIISDFLKDEIASIDERLLYRGIGMIWGVDFNKINPKYALECVHECYNRNLIIEVAGRHDGVLKIMPALTIPESVLLEGLIIIKDSIKHVLNK